MKVSAPQLRAARALLDWTQSELSERSLVHRNAIVAMERGEAVAVDAKERVVEALKAAGIVFETDNGFARVSLPTAE